MPSRIPHQKICIYHLPTRGRAGIKLGDAWYVSNVSIIFYCSMLLYYPFWMFMGFILHIYIIFGTNLLTGGPTHIAVFLPISVFRRKGISNGVQTEWNLRQRDFLEEYHPGDVEFKSEDTRGLHEIGGRAPRGAPLSRGPLKHPRPTSFAYIYSCTQKTSESTTKPYFHRRNLLYSWDPISGPPRWSPSLHSKFLGLVLFQK